MINMTERLYIVPTSGHEFAFSRKEMILLLRKDKPPKKNQKISKKGKLIKIKPRRQSANNNNQFEFLRPTLRHIEMRQLLFNLFAKAYYMNSEVYNNEIKCHYALLRGFKKDYPEIQIHYGTNRRMFILSSKNTVDEQILALYRTLLLEQFKNGTIIHTQSVCGGVMFILDTLPKDEFGDG